jgi:hypothetical protein
MLVLPSLPGETPRMAVGASNGVVYVVELEEGIACRDTRTRTPDGDGDDVQRAQASVRRWARLIGSWTDCTNRCVVGLL